MGKVITIASQKGGCAITTMVLVSNADTMGEMVEPSFGEKEKLDLLYSFW